MQFERQRHRPGFANITSTSLREHRLPQRQVGLARCCTRFDLTELQTNSPGRPMTNTATDLAASSPFRFVRRTVKHESNYRTQKSRDEGAPLARELTFAFPLYS